jgi:hypothetical protein
MNAPPKPRVLVYGNCQGGWLADTLRAQSEIAAQFEIIYLSDYQERPPDHPINESGFLATCSVVIWQTASGCNPPWFLAEVPAHVRQIRYPTLWLKLLWPTYAVDPRNIREDQFPWGRYPYGDRLVMKLLEQGVNPADIPQRYADTDLNTIVNLARFTEMSLAELRFNDRQSDVAITPFIESTFRTRKLFGSINHPTFAILHQIFHGVAAALLDRPPAVSPPCPANADEVLGNEEVPLHPQIIEHFKLSWAFPGMRWRYHSAFLTAEEYLQAYAAFTPIPLGHPPSLWLARARQAAEQADVATAQRLLLEASAHYPEVPEFLQFLGLILTRHGQLLEAEKVFRYAIAQHPRAAALPFELGRLMLRQNFTTEAARLFNETLRLDPQHKEARRQLILTAARPRSQPVVAAVR